MNGIFIQIYTIEYEIMKLLIDILHPVYEQVLLQNNLNQMITVLKTYESLLTQ